MCAVWLGICIVGMLVLVNYSNAPGRTLDVPIRLEDRTPANGRYSLMVFLHPRCACSAASVNELARLLTRSSTKVDTTVYVYHPQDQNHAWSQTRLIRASERIPGVKVELDIDGVKAKRFGAATSGHALLYAPDQSLAFSGGITASRGHEGDNAGSSAIIALISGQKPHDHDTPVFGCAIFGEREN